MCVGGKAVLLLCGWLSLRPTLSGFFVTIMVILQNFGTIFFGSLEEVWTW